MQEILSATHQLHQVSEGRFFARSVRADDRSPISRRTMIVAVVAVPRSIDVERMHLGRLNTHLWLDVVNSTKPNSHWNGVGLAELDAGGLLMDFRYRGSVLTDTVDLFVRATALPHENKALRWVYLIGAAARQLECAPVDGLYEVGSAGIARISDDPHMGEPPSVILRKALWGPQGRYGLQSSMEPTHFPKWLAQERADQRRRRESNSNLMEPLFLPYAQLVGERFPEERPFYTAEQEAGRDAYSRRVLGALMAADEALQAKRLAEGDPSPWRYASEHPKEHEAFVVEHARRTLAEPCASNEAVEKPAPAPRRARP